MLAELRDMSNQGMLVESKVKTKHEKGTERDRQPELRK